MSNFKIQGVGLDTSSLRYPLEGDKFDYIITNLTSNNDYYLKEYLKENNSILIVKTPYLDSVEISLRDHLEELGRSTISLLFVESGALWGKAEKIPCVESWGIAHPTTIEEIKEADSALEKKGLKLEYVLLSACPLDYNAEIFEYINNLGLTIFIDNPMGGYLSGPRNIEAFSAPYLLCFAANLGSVVVVSSRDIIKAMDNREYLKALIGKESSEMFDLKKTIQKPVKPVKKVIYTSTKVSENIIIPYSDPELITITEDTIFSIGKWEESLIPIEEIEPDSVEGKIRHLLEVTHIPEDANREAIFTHLRYRVENYIEGYLSEDYPDLEYSYTDSIMLITATKPSFSSGYLWWYKYIPEEKRYFCFMLGNNNEPLFYEINSPMEVENP